MYKILYVPSFYPIEGEIPRGIFFKDQVELLSCKGINIDVLCCENRSIRGFSIRKFLSSRFKTIAKVENGVLVFRLKYWNLVPTKFKLGRLLWSIACFKLFKKYVHKYGLPDLIHVQCILSAGFVAKKIKKQYGIPYIITEHSSGLKNIINFKRLNSISSVLDESDSIVTVSSFLQDQILGQFDFKKRQYDKVIPNFIDSKFFIPSPVEESKNIIFTVSYHTSNKRIDIIIKAFSQISYKHENYKLVIGGNGEETEALKKLAVDLKIDNKVVFPGFLSKNEIKYFLNRAKVFMLASEYETFGVVLLEAMAMGVPVIVSNCGGPKDIVKAGCGKILPQSSSEFAISLDQILSEECEYNANAIRNSFLDNFGEDIVIEKYKKLYDDILSKNFT